LAATSISLRGRQREERHRRAAQRRDPGDLHRAGDPEVKLGPARDDADLLPDLEAVLARGRRVDVDLVGRGRPAAAGQRQRVEALTGRDVAEREPGRAAMSDHLAVVADEPRLVADRSGCLGNAGQRAYTRQ
jgi:hypothetical protein